MPNKNKKNIIKKTYRKIYRKTYRKNTKTKKNRNKNKKGGSIDMNFGIFSSHKGTKRYNWKTGKMDDLNCYGVGPFKWCKIVPASQ